MGGFLGIGGSSAKTDRGRQLGGWNAEWNVFNSGFPVFQDMTKVGTATTAKGVNDLNDPLAYWKSILSGDKPSVMQAIAPTVNAVTDQADAAKREQAAMGTARGGGAVGANQQVQSKENAAIQNAFMGAMPTAAKEVAGIGETEASLGQRQLAAALQALGLTSTAADNIVNQSTTSRQQSFNMNPANALPGVFTDALLGALGF